MYLLRGAFLSRMLCSAALKELRGATEERIERRRTARCLILEQDGTHTIRHSSALFRLFRVKSQSIFLLTILPRPLKRKVGVPKFNLYNFRITFAFKLPYCWVLASTSRWSFWMHWRLIIDKLRFPPLQESHQMQSGQRSNKETYLHLRTLIQTNLKVCFFGNRR